MNGSSEKGKAFLKIFNKLTLYLLLIGIATLSYLCLPYCKFFWESCLSIWRSVIITASHVDIVTTETVVLANLTAFIEIYQFINEIVLKRKSSKRARKAVESAQNRSNRKFCRDRRGRRFRRHHNNVRRRR